MSLTKLFLTLLPSLRIYYISALNIGFIFIDAVIVSYVWGLIITEGEMLVQTIKSFPIGVSGSYKKEL